MNILIWTMTRDRLDFTKHCFQTLEEKACCYPYDHLIIDNGSKDGTVEWLKENKDNFVDIIFNEDNKGVHIGWNMAKRYVEEHRDDYNLIIKMDNDCEIVTNNILVDIIRIFDEGPGFYTDFLISPRVEGIANQPQRFQYRDIGGYKLGMTGYIGGLFFCCRTELFLDVKMDKTKPMGRGADSHFCMNMMGKGIFIGYAEDLVVNHYLTTVGQGEKYPKYIERKRIDEQTPYKES